MIAKSISQWEEMYDEVCLFPTFTFLVDRVGGSSVY